MDIFFASLAGNLISPPILFFALGYECIVYAGEVSVIRGGRF
jgi:hypothetical protein